MQEPEAEDVTTETGGDLRSWVGKYVGILKASGSNRSELANWEDPPPHFPLRGPDGAALHPRDVTIISWNYLTKRLADLGLLAGEHWRLSHEGELPADM